MEESQLVNLIQQIINSNMTYVEIKTNNLYIKATQEVFNTARNEICCTTHNRSEIIEVKSQYVGMVNIFNHEINNLYVKRGERVKLKQLLCTINFLKVAIEILSPANGTILEILVKDNDMVQYGQVIFKIESYQS